MSYALLRFKELRKLVTDKEVLRIFDDVILTINNLETEVAHLRNRTMNRYHSEAIQKEIVRMRVEEKLSFPEISRRLGIPRTTSRNIFDRLKRKV